MDSTNGDLRNRISPIPLRSIQIPNTMNPSMNMDISFFTACRFPSIPRPTTLIKRRSGDRSTAFIVAFAARIVGGRKECQNMAPFWTLHSIESKKAIVGGDQHGSGTEVIESTAGLNSQCHRLTGISETSARVHILNLWHP